MIIKKRAFIVSLFFLAVIGLNFGVKSLPSYAATFDNSNIIDDSIFDNNQTMTATDIQNFLNAFPNSCLKNYTSPYPTSYTQYGANVSAATVIRRAADLWGINPQVILTTLEKEESLVTGGAGCASWQYNSAMGMGCPDSGACPDPTYAGFSQQVTKGAWQLMFNRERAEGNTTWDGDGDITYGGFMTAGNRARIDGGPTSYYDGYTTIDGTSVYISNGATASLYTYTPHFSGNQSFDNIFTSWFGVTHGTILIQSPASPAVFLQDGTNRYGIPSYDTLKAYGFDKIKVTPVSDSYMQSLTNVGVLGTTFSEVGYGSVYLADNGYRFGFSTNNQCINWGFPNCLSSASSMALSPYIFNLLGNGGDMKSLMLNGSSVYLMDAGTKRPFFTGAAMTQNGYTGSDITPITNNLNLQQPIGYSIPENNSFVTFAASPVIYIYNNGLFYPINSYDVFRSILPPGAPVYSDSISAYNTQLPAPQKAVSAVLSTQSGTKTYLFSNGNKYDISGVTSSWPTAQAFDEISGVINAVPTAAVVGPNSTFQTPAGFLFKVDNQTVEPFYSLYDYFSSPYAKQPLTISPDTISGLTTTNPLITPGAGSVYQVNTSGKQSAIFTLNLDGTSCALSSVNQLGGFRLNTSNVHSINESMTTGNILSGLVKSSNGSYYIVSGGSKTLVSTAALTSWGVNQSVACSFTQTFLDTLPTIQTSKTMTFARLPSGLIYYSSSNQAHLINTYATFLSLGGNTNNTVDVSSDFSTYVTVGSSIN
jgi:hypothetical protein